MEVNKNDFAVFEVSWEVCNQVGGIYTVLSSKAPYAVESLGENYILIGPDFNNSDFIETNDNDWDELKCKLQSLEVFCRFGKWKISSSPQTILIDYRKTKFGYSKLYELLLEYDLNLNVEKWNGVDSAVFGFLSAVVISELGKYYKFVNKHKIGHFHEWMCGSGILYLKSSNSNISTVFTTHATSIGRFLSKLGINVFAERNNINADFEAKRHNIATKHFIEKMSALNADFFTTISENTALEASSFLKRIPNIITYNGFDIENPELYPINIQKKDIEKAGVINNINKILQWDLPLNTKIVFYSGRAEFKNKGLDIILRSLKGIENNISNHGIYILFVCVVIIQPNNTLCILPPCEEILNIKKLPFIDEITDNYYHLTKEFVSNMSDELSLNNNNTNIKFLFIPSFLDGKDGIINKDYWSFLPLCDVGVYPSFYEPWGYTPHETAMLGVSTITTDLSGFGQWVRHKWLVSNGIFVLNRKHNSDSNCVEQLKTLLIEILTCSEESSDIKRITAHKIALECSWDKMYKQYIKAYTDVVFQTNLKKTIVHETK